jgi:hypothetical protein
MSMIVAMPLIMVMRVPVRFMRMHGYVFYVLRRFGAAVVGWLTTPYGDFVDASGSHCHYQKRCIRTILMRRFTG